MQIDCVSRHDNEAKGNWDDNSSNSQFYQLYNEIAKVFSLMFCPFYFHKSLKFSISYWLDSGHHQPYIRSSIGFFSKNVGNTSSLDQQEMVYVVCRKKKREFD